MKSKYLLLLFSFLLFSCAVQKPAKTPKDINSSVEEKEFFSQIKKSPEFSELKIASKITPDLGKFIPPIDATIYLEKDQKVWMNLSALFFNVGRALATPERIQGYEKWNKTYIDTSFNYVNSLLGVNFIDLSSLQKLLIGKTFIPINPSEFELSVSPSSFTLRSTKNQVFEQGSKRTEYQIILEYASNFDLKKVLLQEVNSTRVLEVYYSDFELVGSERLAKNVKLVIKGDKPGTVLVENTKFERSEMTTPYSVPSGYTKVTIK